MKTSEQGEGNNDAKVFEITFKKLYPRLLAYAITLTNDRQEAKDIVQTTFLRLWERRDELLGAHTLSNYIYTSVRNTFIDSYRKKQTECKLLNYIKASALKTVIDEDDSTLNEKIEILRKQIEDLPPRCRQILIMNKRDGMKYKEIAMELNISIKSVESQMRIAFKKIRESFRNEKLLLFVLI